MVLMMNGQSKIIPGILGFCLSTTPLTLIASMPVDKEHFQATIEYLSALEFEQLLDVEVSLDDTFDIFDGLVKQRSTHLASGIKQSVDRAPAMTSVITAQDIEAMGARTLEEALQSVPGLLVYYSYSHEERYNIRGIHSSSNEAVLVLLNGIRLNNARNGGKAPIWSGFPLSQIQRIEIIRGPGSAVYGAEAFSGVINIITKTALEIDGSEVGARLGNNNTQELWWLHGQQVQGFDVAAMVNMNDTDGHRRTVESDAQSVFDRIFDTQASLAPGPYGAESTTLDVRLDVAKQYWRLRTGLHKGDDIGSGAGIAQALDPTEPEYENVFNVDLTYHHPRWSQYWGLQAQASYLQSEWGATFIAYPPGAFGANPLGMIGTPAVFERQTQLSVSGLYHGIKRHLVRVGGGYIVHDMYKTQERRNFGMNPYTGLEILPDEMIELEDTDAIGFPESARNSYYFFIQDSWRFNAQWELTTGVRYDHYSDSGSSLNPRLGLVWEPRTDLTLKGLYGQAFRVPAFQEMFARNNPIVLGQPDLQAEKIDTFELAIDYRATRHLHLAFNLFHYNIQNKIILQPTSDSRFIWDNSASWKGQGGEFELRWKTSQKSSLLLNYSIQDSTDEQDADTPFSAQQMMYVRGDYLLGTAWYLDAQINWIGARSREAADPRADLRAYHTLDLTVRRKTQQAGGLNMAFSVRNVFDEDVRYPSLGPSEGSDVINIPHDLPGAGRSYFIELRYSF